MPRPSSRQCGPPLWFSTRTCAYERQTASFYQAFGVSPAETEGNFIYDLGNHQWNIPRLRTLLEELLPQKAQFHDFEVKHEFEGIGLRSMLLNARTLHQQDGRPELILLAIEDITERKGAEEALLAADRAKDDFLAMLSHELRTRSMRSWGGPPCYARADWTRRPWPTPWIPSSAMPDCRRRSSMTCLISLASSTASSSSTFTRWSSSLSSRLPSTLCVRPPRPKAYGFRRCSIPRQAQSRAMLSACSRLSGTCFRTRSSSPPGGARRGLARTGRLTGRAHSA